MEPCDSVKGVAKTVDLTLRTGRINLNNKYVNSSKQRIN